MKSLRFAAVLAVLLLAVLACNLPGPAAPTPFVFPTPNLTMTAIFAATLEAPLPETSTPTETIAPTQEPTQTQQSTATNTIPANVVTSTATATKSLAGPGARPNYSVVASYFDSPPTIDGNLGEWPVEIYSVDHVVYGGGDYAGSADLSANARIGWDEEYLYVGVRVKDDHYVQNASGENIFKGDSVEILLDRQVSVDFYLNSLSADDYQLGLAPGSPLPGDDPEAYLWFPSTLSGSRSDVELGVTSLEDGYRLEAAIPWDVFDVSPETGDHYGFAVSVSDNDDEDENVQQSMVSNDPARNLADPTTWGDLTLVNP